MVTGVPVPDFPDLPLLWLRVRTPAAGLVRIEVGGEVDMSTAGRPLEATEETLRRYAPRRLEVDLAEGVASDREPSSSSGLP